MISSYDVVQHHNLNKLIDIVRTYLDRGWKCQGGIAIIHIAGSVDSFYYQAMIKEDSCYVTKT